MNGRVGNHAQAACLKTCPDVYDAAIVNHGVSHATCNQVYGKSAATLACLCTLADDKRWIQQPSSPC